MARSVSRASVGTARNALAALTATRPPRPVWPRMTPSPPPRAMAAETTATESSSWCQNRVGTPWEPVQFADVVNQSNTWARKDMSAHRPGTAGPGPGDENALRPDQEEVGHGGQGDGEDEAHDDRRVIG